MTRPRRLWPTPERRTIDARGLPATGPLPGRLRSRALAVALLAAAATLACTDGYPTDDAALINPYGMSDAQRLGAMNRLGKEGGDERQWRFRLLSPCELRVRELSAADQAASAPGEATVVDLREAGVSRQFDREAGRYAIALAPDDAEGAPVSVLEGARWTDATEMQAHLQLQQRDCLAAEPAETAGGANPP